MAETVSPARRLIDTRFEQMFPKLEPAEIERLRRFGETRTYSQGDRLVTAGDVSPGMFGHPDRRGCVCAGQVVSRYLVERIAGLPSVASLDGVFANGDVRAGSTKRVAAAVGEGAQVIATIHAHLADQTTAGGLREGA